MLAILDAAYSDTNSAVACVTAENWASAKPLEAFVLTRGPQKAYAPGEFYRRELPLLLAALKKLDADPGAILIDGYVWLDANGRRGLGAHLYEALGQGIPVMGAAKTRFAGAEKFAEQVIRGRSTNPLWITSAGIDASEAAANVRSMHGEHRIPALVALADRLARQACSP
jgi:deoxyribonuclease V